jgi:hypothetical protein
LRSYVFFLCKVLIGLGSATLEENPLPEWPDEFAKKSLKMLPNAFFDKINTQLHLWKKVPR